jgi:DNA-binding IscR family transcriptional regulator
VLREEPDLLLVRADVHEVDLLVVVLVVEDMVSSSRVSTSTLSCQEPQCSPAVAQAAVRHIRRVLEELSTRSFALRDGVLFLEAGLQILEVYRDAGL